ncbi:hypothetical protein [Aerococcus sp. L_32]|uniref:hypothetical protein n=1 Tax=Aerococcus sp. L_32 TaxID=3422316 RepID=UPI003D6BFF8C
MIDYLIIIILLVIVKFIPWQLGHMATISEIFSNYESLSNQILTLLFLDPLFLIMAMRIFRPIGRHIGDLIAGTQVKFV